MALRPAPNRTRDTASAVQDLLVSISIFRLLAKDTVKEPSPYPTRSDRPSLRRSNGFLDINALAILINVRQDVEVSHIRMAGRQMINA